jgi:serine/threonine protein kinase
LVPSGPNLGRAVALKAIDEALAVDPERVQRFEQEARLAGALNHPNLVAVHDWPQRQVQPQRFLAARFLSFARLSPVTKQGEHMKRRFWCLLLLCGCSTSSTLHSTTGIGQFGDRILVRRATSTVHSSGWTGTGLTESEEFALCKLDDHNLVQCERTTMSMPPPSASASR